MAVGQPLAGIQESLWATVEGKVVSVDKYEEGLELELRSGNGRMRVLLSDPRSASPRLLLNSRIQATGLCSPAWTLDGQKVAGFLVVTNHQGIRQLEIPPELWQAHSMITIRDLRQIQPAPAEERLVHIGGRILSERSGHSLVVSDGTGQITVRTTQAGMGPIEGLVEILGRLDGMGTNAELHYAFYREMAAGAIGGAAPPAVLTTAGQIKRLKREEALRGYPARIQGVITCVQPKFRAVVIQDSTLGIYVKNCPYDDAAPPRLGEYWEVEGITDAGFAPMIQPHTLRRLGEGILPEPIRPTRDQLMSGSLDTQYVELQGVVTEVTPIHISLLTRSGKILVRLPGHRPPTLKPYENSLISLRGCLFARHSSEDISLELILGEVEIHNARIKLDEPAPADLFSTTSKRISDLLLFDPDAGALQRVKVTGQIVHFRQGMGFLMEGEKGLRFMANLPANVLPSDVVEVVGFPELGGPSPIVSEAVVRKTGSAPLPQPKRLAHDDLLNDAHDSILVLISGSLVSLSQRGDHHVLALQAGVQKFLAHLERDDKPLKISPGSLIEVKGVYSGQGARLGDGHDLSSFELLLRSRSDIRVLARPPWWTLGRLMAVVGALSGVLMLAAVYIGLLHRQVEQRTVQLKKEIRDRERAEHKHALEQERSRVARDLHDDLGSTLTEISMLAEAGRDGAGAPAERFERILARARSLVRALDEIVWAIDPRKDTLSGLTHYLTGFAEDYLSAAGLTCRVKMPSSTPEVPLPARERHQLFLAVKETLNNIVKHSRAGQVLFEVSATDRELLLTITDNGCGFDPQAPSSGNGTANLSERLQRLGGRCQINSALGGGTTVLLALPLNRNSSSV
jgi:signal transduction histidine kinase